MKRKGALIASHMIIVGITLFAIVALTVGLSAVQKTQQDSLAEGLAAELCARVKLAAEQLWNDNAYRSSGVMGSAALSLPAKLGNGPYVVTLADKTATVQGGNHAGVCKLSVGAAGSGRAGGGNVKLVWSYDGSDKMELVAV